jgi:cell division septal protein FtsQ
VASLRAHIPRRSADSPSLDLSRLVPSTRSVVAGVALLLTGMIAFAVARQSSIFAIRKVEVVGAQPQLERQVREALAPLIGTSLVALDGSDVQRRLDTLPQVRHATYDRDFPNTLRIFVEPDEPVAILRSGADGWLVSAHGAVLSKLQRPFALRLPRIWVSRDTINGGLPAAVDAALRGLAIARRSQSALLPDVSKVKAAAGELTFVLRSHVELRLGDARDIALKLAVADRVLASLNPDERRTVKYLDLTLPSRPVTGTNPKV